MDSILSIFKPIIEAQSGNFAIIGNILMIIGALRVVFKPLMSLLQAIVSITPSVTDDSLLAKVLESKIYQVVSYALDWTASIKLPQKKDV